MNKKLALIIGAIVLFILLNILTGGKAWTIVILALVAFGIYKYNSN